MIVSFNAAMALETESLVLPLDRLRLGVAAVLNDASKGSYLLAERDGGIAGQMLVTYEWSDWRNGTFWWVQSVYVAPEHRNRTVFQTLYRHVEAEARKTPEVCGLRLYVERDNRKAQKVYWTLGMHQTDYLLFEDDFVIGRSPASFPSGA